MAELPNAPIGALNPHVQQTKGLKIGDHRVSTSCEVTTVMVNLFRHNFRPEVDNDVISVRLWTTSVWMSFVTFGDSRSNGSVDIRGAGFVSNERTNMIEAYPNGAKPYSRFA